MDRLDLWLFSLGRLPQVVIGLQLIPDSGVGAKRGREAQRHIGRDAGVAIEDAGKRGAGNLQMLGGGGYIHVAKKLP